jgi:acyl-CoA thioesterase I
MDLVRARTWINLYYDIQMRKLCPAAIAAIAVLLCGCGSKDTPPKDASKTALAPAPPASPPAPADARPMIACFGDSLTAGQGLDNGQSYPDVLQRQLDRGGYHYRVANFGVSGDTTQDGLGRLPMVLAEKPAIVVLEFGANDGLRGQPVTIAESNLAQMIEQFQSSGTQVVLAGITLPPNYGPAYIQRFDAMYTSLAAKYKLKRIPFLLAGVAGDSRFMQRDGLHPNAEGARIVADTVARSLQAFLQK